MNHLTTREIFQIVDGTTANGEKTRLLVHLETCERCRHEVRFHRSLGEAAKEATVEQPSKGFTARVIGKIAPETKKSWASRIIDNLGNVIAMGLVLSAVFYAVNMAPASRSAAEPSGISKALTIYTEYYAKARDAASNEIMRVVGQPKKEPTSHTADAATLTLISLLILVAIDRFVVRRLVRIRL